MEVVISAFTDHLAVCMRMKLKADLLQRGMGLWKMNTKRLEDTSRRIHIQQQWTRWRLQEGKYPDKVTWSEKYVERKIRLLFIQ